MSATGRVRGRLVVVVGVLALLVAFSLMARSGSSKSTSRARGPHWSGATSLVAVRIQTFSPELAVNGNGTAIAAWFSGPPPRVTAGSGGRTAADTSWTGNGVMVALGSVQRGFGVPKTIASNGDDVEHHIQVALSGSNVAYVVWQIAERPFYWMISTAHRGHFEAPKRLTLPHHARPMRLAMGLDGPVDAFAGWLGPAGRYIWSCTRLRSDGSTAGTVAANHPSGPNPCQLRDATRMVGEIPPRPMHDGYDMAPYSLVSRSDGRGDSIAIWDDWPTNGPAWTYGLFSAIKRR